jgi:DNA-binding transcriptional regulator YiaG
MSQSIDRGEAVIRVGHYEVKAPYEAVPLDLPTGAASGLTSDEWERLELQAAAVVLSRSEGVGGLELRFARKALGLSQGDLGALLGVALETVCRWETADGEISAVVRLAVLHLLDRFRSTGTLEAVVPSGLTLTVAA